MGPLPGKMQLLSVVLVAVLLEPYSDSGAMPDVTLVTSNSTYPAYPGQTPTRKSKPACRRGCRTL